MELAGQEGSARGQADEARPVRRGRSIEYWFRCMDLDGDGVLSMFELEYFYEEQCRRLDSMAIEALPFEDCLCQMLDLVKPQNEGNSCRGHPVTCDSHSGRASLLRVGDGWAGPQGGAYQRCVAGDSAQGSTWDRSPLLWWTVATFRHSSGCVPLLPVPFRPPVRGSRPAGWAHRLSLGRESGCP